MPRSEGPVELMLEDMLDDNNQLGNPLRIRKATQAKRCWSCSVKLIFGAHETKVNGEPALMCTECIDMLRPEEVGPPTIQHRAGHC